MLTSLTSYITSLQKYLLSDDRSAFINSLKADSKERMVLELLTLRLEKDVSLTSIQEKFKEIGIDQSIAEEFIAHKALSLVTKAKTKEEAEIIFQLIQNTVGAVHEFNHPKPIDIAHSNQEEIAENRTQNQANFAETFAEIIEQKLKMINQTKSLDNFTNYGLSQIPLQTYSKFNLKVKQLLLTYRLEFFRTFPDKFVINFINNFLDEVRAKQNPYYSLPSSMYSSLTKSQLELLLQIQPDVSKDFRYMQYWYKQNYVEKLDRFSKNATLNISEKEQKRKLLIQILDEIRKFNTLITKSLEEQTFMELLILDLSLENPKKKIFLEFLQNLYVPCNTLSDSYNRRVQTKNQQYQSQQVKENSSKAYSNSEVANDKSWHSIHNYEMISWTHDKLISEYLVALFKMEDNPQELINQLTSYLNEQFLNKMSAKVKLVKGELVPNVNNILKANELAQLKDKKKVSILAKNKKIFKVDQDVVLTIRVKNVKNIKVKIYELNLEKSYLQKQIKIDENMNLSFLEPTKSFDYQVENINPYKESLYDLPIKQIEKKQAVYIVDLQGEGISSRAVIRKGGIVCLKRTTVAGLELKFYDEEGRRIQNLDLWINSKKESVKNIFTIPFSKAAQNLNLIAVRGSYAELITVAVPAESYSWEIGYIYGNQSFIVGNKAKIAIHPQLKLQGECIGLKILTKSKITVETTNSQDIKSYYSFDNIQWSATADYILQFPIQSYTKNISIKVNAEIPLYCGEKFKLQDTKSIDLQLNESTSNFISPYLNKVNNEYYLYLLGQNGEAIPNTDVTVSAYFLGVKQPTVKLLRTNAEGSVKLGKLSLINYLDVDVQTQSINIRRSWEINNKKQEVNYANHLNYKKGEIINLPIPTGLQIHNIVLLKKGVEGLINSNATNLAVIKEGRLIIEGLQAGIYELYFIPLEVIMNIEILSGKQWEATNQVYSPQKETVYQILRSANHLIGLGQAKITEKEDKIQVKIPLNLSQSGLTETLRAHVIIENYQSPYFSGAFNSDKFVNAPKSLNQKFALKENQYFNNKTLSDEGSYVENRQNEKKFIGNNLEKPRIFLRREEVRCTSQQQEVLQKEGAFYPSMNAGDSKRAEKTSYSTAYANTCPIQSSNIDAHNNFLECPAIFATNIKEEVISFEVPKGYNNFKVFLLSHDGAIQKNYSLNFKYTGKLKDLRHVGIKDSSEDKGWTMSRQVYHLHEGEELKINRDSVWSTIGLSNIAAFAQIKSQKVKDWLTSWHQYSPEKKQEVYEKQFCHEINVFIKQNDGQFFKTVVAPFLENKVTKTFVDFALLDRSECLEYTSIEKLETLNDFEKILLIKYLISHKVPERAKEIAKSLELKQKINKISFDEFKVKFDTVINSKKTLDLPPNPQVHNYSQNMAGEIFGIQPSYGQVSYAAYNAVPQVQQSYGMPVQPSYGMPVQMQQMSFDPFSNVGYGQMQQIQQASYAPPAQPQHRNWAMDAENRSYRTNQVINQPQQQSSYSTVNKSNKRFESSKINVVPQSKMMMKQVDYLGDYDGDQEAELLRRRQKFKQGFKAVEKTKQYTETTYRGMKKPNQSTDAINSSCFWSILANHLIDNPEVKFLTEAFMHLNSQREFTLGMCFLKNGVNADFNLKNEGESIIITAKNSFSIFIKELRPTSYVKKFGVMINQRFFDPFNRYTYEEDATEVEKEVSQFVVRKVYSYQTVVTNTSGTQLELQLLLDIPQGSIPLESHEYTQIKSVNISPYSTSSFQRSFYFPHEGKFAMYSANACRGKQIISKGPSLEEIEVKTTLTTDKMESFNDIIRVGNEADVLQFLSNKNIFDSNIFLPDSIFWMLKNKPVFQKIIAILRSRCYFNQTIWSYSFLHKDFQGIKQLFSKSAKDGSEQFEIPIFEYFPYFSSRTHKFLNESKSTIRNVEFKNTYQKFLINVILSEAETSATKITFLYYLLLQDRIEEASNLYSRFSEDEKSAHRLQADYFECFLDMYQGYPSFAMARKISSSYVNYPIATWKNLFKEVYDLLKDYDEVTYVEEETKVQYKTVVIKQPSQLRISIPPNTKIEVFIFSINLELYFSEYPFSQFKDFSTIKPMQSISYAAGNSREEKLSRPEQVKDMVVEIYESKEGKPAEKLDSYHWAHPDLKIKLNESKGNAQVFFKGKQYPGCYCKVYTHGKESEKYYRDGYTDITGTFKYVLGDVENITKFKILFVTEHGGVILEAKPPSTAGTLA